MRALHAWLSAGRERRHTPPVQGFDLITSQRVHSLWQSLLRVKQLVRGGGGGGRRRGSNGTFEPAFSSFGLISVWQVTADIRTETILDGIGTFGVWPLQYGWWWGGGASTVERCLFLSLKAHIGRNVPLTPPQLARNLRKGRNLIPSWGRGPDDTHFTAPDNKTAPDHLVTNHHPSPYQKLWSVHIILRCLVCTVLIPPGTKCGALRVS